MDVNELRTIITSVSFLLFLVIVFWAFSSRQKSRFEEAANLPFDDDEVHQRTLETARQSSDPSNRKSGD